MSRDPLPGLSATRTSACDALRSDLRVIARQIPDGVRILDLGCGDGELLAHQIGVHGCTGTGVEIDPDAVVAAIRAGVPVIEADVDSRLDDFADRSYDVVVLSRTIQTIQRPEQVLRDMARIADRLIVSVPNFGWWGHRLRLLGGRMPMSKELPYRWHNTPNIRHTTLADLEELFDALGLRTERRYTFTEHGRHLRAHDVASNLMAGAAVYVLRP